MFFFKRILRIRKAFATIAGQDKLIDYQEWKHCLNVRNDVLATRMFALVDTDHSGYIDRHEFTEFSNHLLNADTHTRLQFVFKICDMDEDGFVGADDIKRIISASAAEQGIRFQDYKINDLVNCFLDSTGVKRKKGINEEEFVRYLESTQGVDSQFDSFLYNLLGISLRGKRKKIAAANWFTRIRSAWSSRWKDQLWYLFYWAANISLFAGAVLEYREQGASLAVQIARGGGACLNFNCALVLLPMCRSLHSWLRHTFLFRLLPLDNLTEIHKGIAYAIVAFSGIHIAAHFSNYWLTGQVLWQVLLFTVVGATGVVCTVALLAMWYTGHRRHQHYETFLNVHLLYAPFMIALLYHGPVFWQWLGPAMALFALDGAYRMILKYRTVEITELRSLSDRVTQVRFKRGRLFPFKPGDYVKVKIPEVSSHQWHPFTLSAAPESTRLDIHVRNNGDWSGALHNLANRDHCQKKKWKAYVDGPYSAPTSSIYRSEVAILIAGGIGVTPFASTLQSILLNRQARKKILASDQMIHFHWLNRTQQSYDWFLDLLIKAEEDLGDDHFRLHIHLTSLARNLSNLIMQFAFDAYWKTYNKDPITELRTRTSAGRPNWDVIFRDLASEYEGRRVDIYFCGPKALGSVIRQMSFKHGLIYHEEKFE